MACQSGEKMEKIGIFWVYGSLFWNLTRSLPREQLFLVTNFLCFNLGRA